MPLLLRPPTPGDETAARRLHTQLLAEDFAFLFTDGPWDQVLQRCAEDSAGVDLPPDRVRADFLLAEVDAQVVGRVSIRYELNDFLHRYGGHVGYAVGPEFRRRGYATEILRQAIERLHTAGIDPILVTCDDDNMASARTIQTCGGQLENIVTPEHGQPVRRYWINHRQEQPTTGRP